jgi:hypothetical protein
LKLYGDIEMQSVAVEIIKETVKAKLVKTESGQQCWIQNRSFKDGLVSEKVIKSSVERFEKFKEKKQEQIEYNNSLQQLDTVWQSEKAIAIDVKAEFAQASSCWHVKTKRIFFPKKLCKEIDNEWYAPGWLIASKFKEALDEMPGYVFDW